MHTFLATTRFLWWFLAAAIVGWWSWRLSAGNEIRPDQPRAHWKNLYRRALLERDESKLGIRIQKAEGAILLELANQLFSEDRRKRRALREAMNNLRRLRERSSDSYDNDGVA